MGRATVALIAFAFASVTTGGLTVTEAQAQSRSDKSAAKKKYEDGKKAWSQKDFQGAIAAFEQSFALDPQAKVLFSLARCYEELAQYERAIEYFEQYLAAPHDDAVAEEARVRKEALSGKLLREKEEDKKVVDDNKEETPVVTKPIIEPDPDPGATLRYAGYITAGAGLGLLLTSAYFGIRAKDLESDIDTSDGMWTDEELSKIKDGERAEKLAIGTGIVGVAAVATGAVLLYLGFTKEGTSTTLVPNQGGGASVITTISF